MYSEVEKLHTHTLDGYWREIKVRNGRSWGEGHLWSISVLWVIGSSGLHSVNHHVPLPNFNHFKTHFKQTISWCWNNYVLIAFKSQSKIQNKEVSVGKEGRQGDVKGASVQPHATPCDSLHDFKTHTAHDGIESRAQIAHVPNYSLCILPQNWNTSFHRD